MYFFICLYFVFKIYKVIVFLGMYLHMRILSNNNNRNWVFFWKASNFIVGKDRCRFLKISYFRRHLLAKLTMNFIGEIGKLC